MVSWICPECACECAPTDHECPDCTDLVHAGMLALAHTVQTQLGSLPPPPPVQSLVFTRFADPKVPYPVTPWPIETEPEIAPVLGLFVPSVAASIQPDVWAEPEPVSQDLPAQPFNETPAIEDTIELAPAPIVTAPDYAEVHTAVPQDLIAEPEIELAPAQVEETREDMVEPEIEHTPAPVETTPVTTEETANLSQEMHAAEPAIELVPTDGAIPPEIVEDLAAEPETEVTPALIAATSETIEEVPSVTQELAASEPANEPALAAIETVSETVAEPTCETEPAATPVETLPETVGAPVVEPENEPAPIPAGTRPELVEEVPTVSQETATRETPETVSACVTGLPEVHGAIDLAPAPAEPCQEAADPSPGEALPDVLPVQEMLPGAVRTVLPKPSDSAEFRYRDTQPEFPPITPLVVSSPSGPVNRTTAPVAQAPPQQLTVSPPNKVKLPGWMISLLVATGLSLGGAVIVRNMGFGGKAEPVSAATSPGETAPIAGSPTAFARFIEVTGLRVVVDLQKGSKVHYILVNHGPTILSNVQLRIDVYSAASVENSKPLFSVAAVVSGLEPSSSREMTANIDNLQDAVIPDWDNLKPKVQVLTQ
jgi:hypothetical protein